MRYTDSNNEGKKVGEERENEEDARVGDKDILVLFVSCGGTSKDSQRLQPS